MRLELLFDHAGFLVWLFFIYLALHDLKNRKLIALPRYFLLFIGIIGVLLDGVLLLSLYAGWTFIQYAWMFDHLGIPVFLFTLFLSIHDLRNKVIKKKWSRLILLIISIGGLIADGFILMRYYFL